MATKATTTTTSPTPTASVVNDQTQDIPIFLRKTFHMVDTCDPAIAGWSDDGESFIVKQAEVFEKQVIPQFFKHNKFTSFVRQLNFYAFRKLKYSDSLTVQDEELPYWRFYHPKFQKGRPEWLKDIKRMESRPRANHGAASSSSSSASPKASSAAAAAKLSSSSSSSSSCPDAENLKLKTEVTSLRERIEVMTKNIDQLTTMVQQVTLQQSYQPPEPPEVNVVTMNDNHKRIKVEDDGDFVDRALAAVESMLPDHTSMDVEAVGSSSSSSSSSSSLSLDGLHPPSPMSFGSLPPLEGTYRTTSEISDEGFVEKLLTVFKEEEEEDDDNDAELRQERPTTSHAMSYGNPENRPRDELMGRLSEALSLLPRDVQEMIVDRLIQAIVSPKRIQESIQVAHALDEVMAAAVATTKMESHRPTSVPQSPKHDGGCAMEQDDDNNDDDEYDVNIDGGREGGSAMATASATPSLPLAAATLAALLSHYGKDHHHHHHDDEHDDEQGAAVAAALKKSKENSQKSLLIPVHA